MGWGGVLSLLKFVWRWVWFYSFFDWLEVGVIVEVYVGVCYEVVDLWINEGNCGVIFVDIVILVYKVVVGCVEFEFVEFYCVEWVCVVEFGFCEIVIYYFILIFIFYYDVVGWD